MDNNTMTCRDGTAYVTPEEFYNEQNHDNKQQFSLMKKRPVLSRMSQESVWNPFELCNEPGTWMIMFGITTTDMSLEIWFGRTFKPLIFDKSYKPGSKDKRDPDPDPLAFKRVAKFPTCTSIHKEIHGDYLLDGRFIVSYVENGKECESPMPLLVNDDPVYYPWNNLKYQFSQKALTQAIEWANGIFSRHKPTLVNSTLVNSSQDSTKLRANQYYVLR